MRYSIAGLQRDVMARLGEIPRPPGQGVGDAEGLEAPWAEDIVARKVAALLGEAGSRLIMESPAELLEEGGVRVAGTSAMRLMPCGMYAAEVRLPGGFLRLVSARMSEWRRSVRTAIGSSSAEWGRQWSAEPGIAGDSVRPRAYLDVDGDGALVRLLGCRSASATLEWLSACCVPEPDESGAFEFPAGLYGALTAEIASRL